MIRRTYIPVGDIDVIVLNNKHPLGHYSRRNKLKNIQGQAGVVVHQEKVWVMDEDGKFVRIIETNPDGLLYESGPERKGGLYCVANSH